MNDADDDNDTEIILFVFANLSVF